MPDESFPRMINLGCGNRFHSAWTNVDIAPTDPAVVPCDLSKTFPFSDGSFDVVYHSNVLEHIRHEHALPFMRECYRILKPAGILRVAVPDLEQICRLYLENLQCAWEHDKVAEARYDWMMLELLDQTVRESGGGGMLDYLRQNPLPGEEFIVQRIGNEGRGMINWIRSQAAPVPTAPPPTTCVAKRSPALWEKLRRIFAYTPEIQNDERDSTEYKIGRFRLSGEVHQWMYDRFSLSRLMCFSGFISPKLMTPSTSHIPVWNNYNLEVGADGSVHKPDSFIMESLKSGG